MLAMRLSIWTIAAGTLLLGAAVSFAGCNKNKDKDEGPFTYVGTWATSKIMNKDVSTNVKAKLYTETLIKAADLFLEGKVSSNVEKVKAFAKETITATIDVARGIKIAVKQEGKTCNVNFAGLGNGVDGTWEEQNGALVLTLGAVAPETLNQLKAETSIKGKVSYAFAANLSGKTLTLSRKSDDKDIELRLDTKVVRDAIAEAAKQQSITLGNELAGVLFKDKSFSIAFYKVN